MSYIDLHTHSYASDGSDSPAQLIIKASELGLSALALTDHDTISGLAEAEEQALKSKLEFIRGCELSALYEGADLHILALWLPHNSSILEEKLLQLQKHRENRNIIMLEKLDKQGLQINYSEVLAISKGESVGRPHLAQVMVQKGYVKSIKDAFTKYLGINGRVYEPKQVLEAKEAISMLTSIGATVSLAHPCILGFSYKKIESIVSQFEKYGLLAIEAYHSEHSPKDQKFCLSLAKKYQLTLTGGSDYHGLCKPYLKLGRGHGQVQVPAILLEDLKEQRVKLGLYI